MSLFNSKLPAQSRRRRLRRRRTARRARIPKHRRLDVFDADAGTIEQSPAEIGEPGAPPDAISPFEPVLPVGAVPPIGAVPPVVAVAIVMSIATGALPSSRRARCDIRKGVRTSLVRDGVFAAIRDDMSSGERLDHARKKLAELLGEAARARTAKLKEHRGRLERIQARITNLIEVWASGEDSTSIREALRDMETHAAAERRELADLEREEEQPIQLPSPDELLTRLGELEETSAKTRSRVASC
ncbi:MAG TPA: hypothetical protein VH062_19380 [Polyangiaceae bacterium]|nr:hypothetical protein [Polyangiaceae bacterium]